MCGIVALMNLNEEPVDEAELVRMRDCLVHRGPDDKGFLIEGHVGLAHRRLKIIDLGGGHQPMSGASGRTHIVFNGEIFNYRELRDHLLSRGIALRTVSDTETILGLYDRYGDACLEYLHGMFSFVLWDSAKRRLFVARDRMGIKPLYVFRNGKRIAFASETKAFTAMEGWVGDVDLGALSEYLVFRDVAGRRTLSQNVERLLPGEMLAIDPQGEKRHIYWTLPTPTSAEDGRTLDDWTHELDDLLSRVVRDHMVSDVPLGTFNSGGVDSSLMTAYAAGFANLSINTHAVAFDDPAYDESRFAKIVAERYRTTHRTYTVDEKEFAALLPNAVWHLDAPLNHPNSIPILCLSRLARRFVTVVITGEGSDELFGGYPRYRLARAIDRAGRWAVLVAPLLRVASRFASSSERARVLATLKPNGFSVSGLSAFVSEDEAEAILSASARRVAGGAPQDLAHAPNVLAATLRFDQGRYLQGLLSRLDKMSMAVSLEGRVPFLDHRVVELAARIPPQWKVHGNATKVIVKKVARKYLPAEIVDRTKAGLAVPVGRWMQSGGVLSTYVDALLEPGAKTRTYLDASAVRKVVDEHRSDKKAHSELLWGLMNVELWLRAWSDATRSQSKPYLRAAQPELVGS